MIVKVGAIMALLMFSPISFAEPIILYDSGRTISIYPYIDALNIPQESLPPVKAGFQAVHTPEMTAGKEKARQVRLPFLTVPLFLIGTDDLSRRWLKKNKASLLKMGAVGMLVEVETEKEFNVMAKLAEGIRLTPASASGLVRPYKLKRYPVLIMKNQITQ